MKTSLSLAAAAAFDSGLSSDLGSIFHDKKQLKMMESAMTYDTTAALSYDTFPIICLK